MRAPKVRAATKGWGGSGPFAVGGDERRPDVRFLRHKSHGTYPRSRTCLFAVYLHVFAIGIGIRRVRSWGLRGALALILSNLVWHGCLPSSETPSPIVLSSHPQGWESPGDGVARGGPGESRSCVRSLATSGHGPLCCSPHLATVPSAAGVSLQRRWGVMLM